MSVIFGAWLGALILTLLGGMVYGVWTEGQR
jgi:hypothetical protein